MDLTPHFATGAALGTRVTPRSLACLLALASEPLLDTVPHYHIGWIRGMVFPGAIDLALGVGVAAMIALKARSFWPMMTAFLAVLPDAPGVKNRWDPWFAFLPHPQWAVPWGILTQVAVSAVALGLANRAVLPVLSPDLPPH